MAKYKGKHTVIIIIRKTFKHTGNNMNQTKKSDEKCLSIIYVIILISMPIIITLNLWVLTHCNLFAQ